MSSRSAARARPGSTFLWSMRHPAAGDNETGRIGPLSMLTFIRTHSSGSKTPCSFVPRTEDEMAGFSWYRGGAHRMPTGFRRQNPVGHSSGSRLEPLFRSRLIQKHLARAGADSVGTCAGSPTSAGSLSFMSVTRSSADFLKHRQTRALVLVGHALHPGQAPSKWRIPESPSGMLPYGSRSPGRPLLPTPTQAPKVGRPYFFDWGYSARTIGRRIWPTGHPPRGFPGCAGRTVGARVHPEPLQSSSKTHIPTIPHFASHATGAKI